MDINRYFTYDDKVVLQNISFETIDKKTPSQLKLSCKDTVVAQLMEHAVKVNFNRALTFEPEGLFSLSVTFGAYLVFKPETKDELDWKNVDLANEIKRSCPRLMTNLMSRASMMVAEITSANGQTPLVTPAAPKSQF